MAENGEKGVKNIGFQARLGNQSIDFSDFWYVTSLIYFFFWAKNALMVDEAYLVTESLIKLNLIVIERFVYSKFEVNNYIVNFTSIIDFNSIY